MKNHYRYKVLQKASNNGRKIVTNLMEVFFTRDDLAVSCAMGIRTAHNRYLKKVNGTELTNSVLNDVINTKCATARQSLKK